jgi:hypothetical protein
VEQKDRRGQEAENPSSATDELCDYGHISTLKKLDWATGYKTQD